VKTKKSIWLLGIVLLVVVATLAVACPSQPTEMAPIKVGFITDLTSYLANVGLDNKAGVELRFSETTEINGHPLQLIVEDDASDPDQAVDKARKLVERDGVVAIMGPLNGGSNAAVSPYLDRTGVPGLLWSPSVDATVVGTQEYFSATGTCRQFSEAAGAYAYDVLGYRTASTMGFDYVAGYEYIQGFADAFTARGGQILDQRWVPMTATEFSPIILGLTPADCTAIWIVGAATVPFYQQYQDLMGDVPIVDVYSELDFPDNFAKVGSVAYDNNTTFFENWIWTDPSPGSAELDANFVATYGRHYGHQAATAYDGASMIIAALEKLGGEATAEELHNALFDTNITTFYGPRFFNSDRVAPNCPRVCVVEKTADGYLPKVIDTFEMQSHVDDGQFVFDFVKYPY
jgi:branched-chain amino acid transport system substrate-binding protein